MSKVYQQSLGQCGDVALGDGGDAGDIFQAAGFSGDDGQARGHGLEQNPRPARLLRRTPEAFRPFRASHKQVHVCQGRQRSSLTTHRGVKCR